MPFRAHAAGVVNQAIILQFINGLMRASGSHATSVTEALRHHAEGIALCIQIFGPVVITSHGREVPTRWVAEQHVKKTLVISLLCRLGAGDQARALDGTGCHDIGRFDDGCRNIVCERPSLRELINLTLPFD
jgi:hypothetical protein